MINLLEGYQALFLWVSFLSLIFFLGSLLALPRFVGKLPKDYFVCPETFVRKPVWMRILRNLLGGIVFFAGVVMLFIPGQGVLTMVASMALMDFPGKAKLIKELAGIPKVRAGLNWLRKKGGHPPLIFPETEGK